MIKQTMRMLDKVCLLGKYEFRSHMKNGVKYLTGVVGEADCEYRMTSDNDIIKNVAHRYFSEEKKIAEGGRLSDIDSAAVSYLHEEWQCGNDNQYEPYVLIGVD